MPSAGNLPLNFHRDRNERQLDARLEELLAKLRKNRPSEDPWLVRRAYEIAAERHRDQVRSSGDPYLSHLLEVAHILAHRRLDATTLTAALLHDVIEDTEFPVSRIEERFGAEVAHLVEGVTKIGRPNKTVAQEPTLQQVYDLMAVRVITDTERNCYAALGVMHHIWRPVPGRFKDYIAMTRPNLYQSLHTTVIHNGQPFEVQIRTQEMHHTAEEGVAAHWKYKDDKPASDDDQRITWMRQLIEWSQELEEPGEFLSTSKVDLAPAEVYAFTPKGRVLELPRGATPVDFAYMVHTEVGHQCVGAKVNGKMVSLRHEITSGDVVEILTQKGHHPSRDWLSFVKSSHAKSKIRHWINVQEREEATEMGHRLLEKEARQFGRSLKKIPEADLLKLASDYGLSKLEDLYAAVGFGKYSARQVLTRVLGEPAKADEREAEDSKPTLVKTVKRMLGFGEAPLIVKGHDDLLVYRAKCCNPIPGDDIIGYITRGRGVAVHTRACPNVQNLLYQTERRIAVEWGGENAATFPVELQIRARDRAGLLADITAVISGAGSNIRNLVSRPDGVNARIDASLEIVDRRQLETILVNIRKIAAVYGVERVYQTT